MERKKPARAEAASSSMLQRDGQVLPVALINPAYLEPERLHKETNKGKDSSEPSHSNRGCVFITLRVCMEKVLGHLCI